MQREETDRMGQMERGHTAEVQPDCMTEAYTVGISETHIRNNATVFRVWQMIECGELTREEGLYLMVNTLADENSNSQNSPENKKRSWHKEPWYKRLFDKILVSCFLPCKHEWEVLEVLWTAHDYSGFKYDVCRCGCKKCGEIRIEKFLV